MFAEEEVALSEHGVVTRTSRYSGIDVTEPRFARFLAYSPQCILGHYYIVVTAPPGCKNYQ